MAGINIRAPEYQRSYHQHIHSVAQIDQNNYMIIRQIELEDRIFERKNELLREAFVYFTILIIYTTILLHEQDQHDFLKLLEIYPEPAIYLLYVLAVFFVEFIYSICLYPCFSL